MVLPDDEKVEGPAQKERQRQAKQREQQVAGLDLGEDRAFQYLAVGDQKHQREQGQLLGLELKPGYYPDGGVKVDQVAHDQRQSALAGQAEILHGRGAKICEPVHGRSGPQNTDGGVNRGHHLHQLPEGVQALFEAGKQG